MNVAELLDRLEGVRKSGEGWTARCPAHHDRNPSLSVSTADDRVLLHCHRGCSTDEVLAALGLAWSDLYDNDTRSSLDRLVVATYDYVDEAGALLFQVCRTFGKRFLQRRPDGNGGWVWRLGDTRRVLFRLPLVVAAIRAGHTVYVAEGEKDVLALEDAGVVATCNPMGAGKWRSEYSESLAGASEVVIVADRDDEGRHHAEQVRAALAGKVAHVRVVEAAEGKDAADHLAAGRGLEDFRPVEPDAGAAWKTQPWPTFRDTAPEQQRWIADGLMPEGALAFIAAPPKKGKTWLGIGLALAVVTGKPLFGAFTIPEPRNVLYIALEGSRTGLRTRIGALARSLDLDPDSNALDRLHMLYRPRPFDLANPETADELQREGDRVDAALVIVDVLRAAARFKENVAEEFAHVRDALEPLLAAGRTVALLHHFGKLSDTQKERSPGERMAGTGAMYGALDVGLLITRSESGARRLRVEVEARDFAAPDALGVVIGGTGSGDHGGFTYADTATLAIDPTAAEERDLTDELERLFTDGVWRTLTEAADKQNGVGANRGEVRDALAGDPARFVGIGGPRVGRHHNAKPWGTAAMLQDLEGRERLARLPEQDEQDTSEDGQGVTVGTCVSPKGERHRDTRTACDSGAAEQDEQDTDDEVPF